MRTKLQGMTMFKMENTLTKFSLPAVLVCMVVLLIGCNGQPDINRTFTQSPIHPQMNMDQQDRFEVNEKNRFFADSSANRMPVEGTVSRGNLKANVALYEGKNSDGSFVSDIPMKLTKDFLNRGRDRYEVFCTPCHGGSGDGNGIIMVGKYGYVPAPTYHDDRLRNVPDGEIYSAIANGIRNMPSYASQIPVEDRWAIVGYVRALQKSQNAPKELLEEYNVDFAALEKTYNEELAKKNALAEAAAASENTEVSVDRGKSIVTANACQACHSLDGSAVVGPTWKGAWGREGELADGTKYVVNEEYVRESILKPQAKVVKGYAPVMVAYPFSDSELASVIEYLKTIQ
jgi:mono/diheme cytochrome c family protein